MVSSSGFARCICLGRSTDSRIYRIGHGRKQHQHRPEHNSNKSSDSRIANQHSDRRGYRLNRRNHTGHSRTVNHHQSKHHYESKFQHYWSDRNGNNIHHAEHDHDSEHHGNGRYD